MTSPASDSVVLTSDELSALFGAVEEGLLVTDVEELRYLYANAPMCALLGYTLGELLALPVAALHPPESMPRVVADVRNLAAQPRPRAPELPFLRKDGTTIYLDAAGSAVTFRGRPAIAGFFRDATLRKQMMDLLRVQRDLAATLCASRDLATALRAILTATMQIEGIDAGMIYAVEPDGGVRGAADAGFSPAFREAVLYYGPGSPEAQMVAASPPSYGRVEDLEGPIRALCEQEGIRCVAVVPVRYQGRALACLNLGSRSRDEIPMAARHAIEAIAERIGAVIARVQVQRAVEESAARLGGLLENVPDLIIEVDPAARILFANRATPAGTPEEMIGREGFGFVAAEHVEDCRAAFARTLAAGQPQSVECRDVFGLWWSVRLVPLLEGDAVRSVLVLLTDTTAQKAAAEAVAREQATLRQIIDLHERERQLMAYEIHDGFTQHLAGAKLEFEASRQHSAADPARAEASFARGLALLSQGIDEARRLIGGLRPPILDELGVVAAIGDLVEQFRPQTEANIEFLHDVEFTRLAPPLESALYRIAQESLINACRHSRSRRIRVELFDAVGVVQLSVHDWGVGFDPTCVAAGRFGLHGMRERVRLLDGRISIATAPDQGTHVTVELPLVAPAPPAEE
jgi:PAS domain S-box-containing protein